MVDQQKLIAKLESKLVRQQAALQDTEIEIGHAGDLANKATDPAVRLALTRAVETLRVKRLRQHNACEATLGYIYAVKNTTDTPTSKKRVS